MGRIKDLGVGPVVAREVDVSNPQQGCLLAEPARFESAWYWHAKYCATDHSIPNPSVSFFNIDRLEDADIFATELQFGAVDAGRFKNCAVKGNRRCAGCRFVSDAVGGQISILKSRNFMRNG